MITGLYDFVTEAKEMYRFHLNLTRVGRSDLATYRCTVRNGHGGEDYYDVELLVKCKWQLILQWNLSIADMLYSGHLSIADTFPKNG